MRNDSCERDVNEGREEEAEAGEEEIHLEEDWEPNETMSQSKAAKLRV